MSDQPITSQYVTAQQIRINYLEADASDWPAVLFLYGASFSAQK